MATWPRFVSGTEDSPSLPWQCDCGLVSVTAAVTASESQPALAVDARPGASGGVLAGAGCVRASSISARMTYEGNHYSAEARLFVNSRDSQAFVILHACAAPIMLGPSRGL